MNTFTISLLIFFWLCFRVCVFITFKYKLNIDKKKHIQISFGKKIIKKYTYIRRHINQLYIKRR